MYFGQASRKTRDQTGSQAVESGGSFRRPRRSTQFAGHEKKSRRSSISRIAASRTSLSDSSPGRRTSAEHGAVLGSFREQLRLDPLLAPFWKAPWGSRFCSECCSRTSGLRAGQHLQSEKIAHFLELTQLDRVVAASYGAQQAYATGVTEQINEYGRSEQQRLAARLLARYQSAKMRRFIPEICLVAIEPVSGTSSVLGVPRPTDTQTWNTSLAAALSGVPVTVIQTVSDEGVRSRSA